MATALCQPEQKPINDLQMSVIPSAMPLHLLAAVFLPHNFPFLNSVLLFRKAKTLQF